jgi:hypothetical protein
MQLVGKTIMPIRAPMGLFDCMAFPFDYRRLTTVRLGASGDAQRDGRVDDLQC